MGWLPVKGTFYDQPSWLIETLAWFIPRYDFMKFMRKADTILGGNDVKNNKVTNPIKTPARSRGRR